MYNVLKKQKIAEGIYELQIEAPHVAQKALPGHFLILRIDDNGERIPFTISDMDNDTITIVFKVRGRTTYELSKLKKGNTILDVAGPLGNPSPIDEYGTVCLASGGMGITNSYIISKALKKKGNKIINIIGTKTADMLFWLDKFQAISDHLIVCTEDGSYGVQSRVTDQLERAARRMNINRVICIGNPLMLKESSRVTYQRTKTRVHLSSVMIDGIGMCGGCRVDISGKTRLICMDGPEFDAEGIDFDSLDNRRRRFSESEKESYGNLAEVHDDHASCHAGCIAAVGISRKSDSGIQSSMIAQNGAAKKRTAAKRSKASAVKVYGGMKESAKKGASKEKQIALKPIKKKAIDAKNPVKKMATVQVRKIVKSNAKKSVKTNVSKIQSSKVKKSVNGKVLKAAKEKNKSSVKTSIKKSADKENTKSLKTKAKKTFKQSIKKPVKVLEKQSITKSSRKTVRNKAGNNPRSALQRSAEKKSIKNSTKKSIQRSVKKSAKNPSGLGDRRNIKNQKEKNIDRAKNEKNAKNVRMAKTAKNAKSVKKAKMAKNAKNAKNAKTAKMAKSVKKAKKKTIVNKAVRQKK